MQYKSFNIKAVLFDFDATLTQPGALDFSVIKKKVGCPPDQPVLEFIENLADADRRADAMNKLDGFEIQAAADSKPNAAAEDLLLYLQSTGIPFGIISRNNMDSIKRALQNFKTIKESDFELIISRDDPVKPKPSGDGILMAAKRMNVKPHQVLVIGDYIYDIQAGQNAGAVTVFLENDMLNTNKRPAVESDFTISSLAEVKPILRLGLPLPAGKFPNDLLQEFFDQFAFDDPSVLINPGMGEDTAAVNAEQEEVLVLKSDPITFATDSIGQYAVLINANDIATSGATSRWLLTTLLFPCGVSASEVLEVMHELQAVCQQWDITLCGGHTEITDAVTRPVVTGMLTGTVAKRDLIDKRNMRSGDHVLLTKGVAVEGTSIIAREFETRLRELDIPEIEIQNCRQFLSQISILDEAAIAGRAAGTSAMHDVTEGGLATALEELSVAGDHRIRIDMEKIPIFPQTENICRLLDIDPMGLIGSGSLLICSRPDHSESLINAIRNAGIAVTQIGVVQDKGRGIEAARQGRRVDWPRFEVDEITRLF